jgi:hypothetical protein
MATNDVMFWQSFKKPADVADIKPAMEKRVLTGNRVQDSKVP